MCIKINAWTQSQREANSTKQKKTLNKEVAKLVMKLLIT